MELSLQCPLYPSVKMTFVSTVTFVTNHGIVDLTTIFRSGLCQHEHSCKTKKKKFAFILNVFNKKKKPFN